MSWNDQLDEQVADLRNIEAESAPLAPAPEALKAESAGGKKSVSKKQVIIVIAIAMAVMGILYFAIFVYHGPASSTPAYRPICPNGQPMPLNQPCPPSPAAK